MDTFERRLRRYACKGCGAPFPTIRDADPTRDDEFPGLRYQDCGTCGRKSVVRSRPRRHKGIQG